MTLAPWVSDGAANLGKWIFGTRPGRDLFVHAHCESQPIERLRTKHRYVRSAAFHAEHPIDDRHVHGANLDT